MRAPVRRPHWVSGGVDSPPRPFVPNPIPPLPAPAPISRRLRIPSTALTPKVGPAARERGRFDDNSLPFAFGKFLQRLDSPFALGEVSAISGSGPEVSTFS